MDRPSSSAEKTRNTYAVRITMPDGSEEHLKRGISGDVIAEFENKRDAESWCRFLTIVATKYEASKSSTV